MKNTVTISIEEFDELRNTFEKSKTKIILERELKAKNNEIEFLNETLNKIIKEDFIEVDYNFYSISRFHNKFYFKKDNTPTWIKKYFNPKSKL